MCGRYGISDAPNPELEEIIRQLNRRDWGREVKIRGEMRPADYVPVVALSKKRERSVFAMQWGFRLPDGRRLINARSETAGEKPIFQDGLRRRRCLIPASEYYEWEKREGDKIKYAVCPPGEALIYLAGIYRPAEAGYEFCVLTRPPAPQIQFIHDRMPVIFSREAGEAWLRPESDATAVLARATLSVAYEKAGGAPEDAQQRIDF